MKCEEPIRILQVGMSPYYGGTEAFIMNQYRKIDREKIQFDFLNVYSTQIACQDEIKELGGKIFNIDMARHHGIRKYYKNLDDFFKKNAKKFYAVHCNYQSLINVDILTYAKKYHIPIRIAHAHNAGYGHQPSFLQKILIAKNRFTIGHTATHYFACSSLAAHWMFHKEAVIINNAIDTNIFCYSEEIRRDVREDLKLNNCKTLIFVGRLDPQKNPIFTLKIFSFVLKKWNDSVLLIVGDGILRKEMEEKSIQLGIEDKVRFLGNRTDVSNLLQASDIFLLPSLFEGLGIVLVEAQAVGMQTYTSAEVVPKEVKITDLLEFISLNKTAEEWAEIITKNGIRKHKDTKEQICNAGYDNHANAKKLEQIYLNMI